jgi:hypothetical protein
MDIGVIIAVLLVVGFTVFIVLKVKENKNKKVTTSVGNPTKPNAGVSPEYRKDRE